ncbi:hypothetical protein PTKIN_Ptkin08bG0038600 [Pterospermum kingtungense]
MKIYPEEMIVTFIYNFSMVILSVLVGLLEESNMSSWRLTPSIVAATVIYTHCCTFIAYTVEGTCVSCIIQPLSIVIAVVMSAIFLGDDLYLRSVIGALILSTGLYTVLWVLRSDRADSFGRASKPARLESRPGERSTKTWGSTWRKTQPRLGARPGEGLDLSISLKRTQARRLGLGSTLGQGVLVEPLVEGSHAF